MLAWVALVALSACRAVEPRNRPLEHCRHACETNAKNVCTPHECERGCEFSLDRLVERETEPLIACVAKSTRRCGDVVWASCAVLIGPHADGGPPAPPPPSDDE